ncbi:MAG: dockerin type I domain-containing protein [Planctomycetota bacterium]|nr:dockerin type I domain-containing protein [Planctomycetota bacterium]
MNFSKVFKSRARSRKLVYESLELRQLMASDLVMMNNFMMPEDADMSGSITPLDALVVINQLNFQSIVNPRSSGAADKRIAVDVDADGSLSPLDALTVINYINRDSADGVDVLPSSVSMENRISRLERAIATGEIPETTDAAKAAEVLAILTAGGYPELGDKLVDGVLTNENDMVNITIPSDAKSFPDVVIDALANDTGTGLRIVAVGVPATGTASIEQDPENPGRDVVRYQPAEQAAKYDRFSYTTEDAKGNRSTSFISVNYEQDPQGFGPFSVDVPEEFIASPGRSTAFLGANGRPLIQVNYDGTKSATVGILLNWAPPEGAFAGDRFAGKLKTSANVDDATFYPQPTGSVWIFGSIPGVNQILANLEYEPAAGFAAPEGIRLNLFAFLYGVVNVDTVLTGLDITVPRSSRSPVAVDDYFKVASLDGPLELDVLINDIANSTPSGTGLQITSISQPFNSDARITFDNATGKVTYTGREYNFLGFDQFAYTIKNELGIESQGIVTLVLS